MSAICKVATLVRGPLRSPERQALADAIAAARPATDAVRRARDVLDRAKELVAKARERSDASIAAAAEARQARLDKIRASMAAGEMPPDDRSHRDLVSQAADDREALEVAREVVASAETDLSDAEIEGTRAQRRVEEAADAVLVQAIAGFADEAEQLEAQLVDRARTLFALMSHVPQMERSTRSDTANPLYWRASQIVARATQLRGADGNGVTIEGSRLGPWQAARDALCADPDAPIPGAR